MFKVSKYIWQQIRKIQGGMPYKEAELTKDDWFACCVIPGAISLFLGLLFGCAIAEPLAGVFLGLIAGAIVVLLTICHRSTSKHRQAERKFLDKLKAKGIEPKVDRVVLPRNVNKDSRVIVYVRGYDGEFWRYAPSSIGEYVTRGEIVDNKIVLTYEHRDKNGSVCGYDTIRTLNVYKEVVSETH